jgi:hypothetical protein
MQPNHLEPIAMTTQPIIIRHNFAPDAFMWLWAKYAVGFNERYHCTNCLRGRYSHRFSKAKNPHLATDHEIAFDEQTHHRAIYICGVARAGYSSKKNYEHNVHLAICPAAGERAVFEFEQWRVEIMNGQVVPIPGAETLPKRLAALPTKFTTCRIFRWGASFLG